MEPLARHLLTEAFNNAWANHRLLGACAQLAQAEFEAPRTGFFPSIQATLNHTLTVDWYYIDSIERSLGGLPPNDAFTAFFEPEVPFASCAALQVAQRESDRRLIALCEPLDAAALAAVIVVPRQAGLTREPLARLLAHLFQHQVHHRGQAHSMLSGTHVAPPQLDEFFCTFDAPLRAGDFHALGFSEAEIWPAE
ncbi:MAG: DinB family protein [Rhizobiales bacterium]|nr:DinB family protein [Rhizobacter sp.]